MSKHDFAMQQLQAVLVDVVHTSKAVSKRMPMQQQISKSVTVVTLTQGWSSENCLPA